MNETFGAVLKRLMFNKGITNAALARAVGCDRTTIGDYTRDKYLPKEETFHRIHQVIPERELYDAFFAATKPKDRKNKPLIKEEKADPSYNYYKAKVENINDTKNFIDSILDSIASKKESAKNAETIVGVNSNSDNKYIAHALLYVVTIMEEEGLMAIAPTDYEAYKKLYAKYEKYIDTSAYL